MTMILIFFPSRLLLLLFIKCTLFLLCFYGNVDNLDRSPSRPTVSAAQVTRVERVFVVYVAAWSKRESDEQLFSTVTNDIQLVVIIIL